MGNLLVIKNADFSNVAVEQVDPGLKVRMEDKSSLANWRTEDDGKTLIAANGWLNPTGGISRSTGFIECEGAAFIDVSMPVFTSSPATQFLAFYSSNTNGGIVEPQSTPHPDFISSIPREVGAEKGMVIKRINVPTGAKYLRTTYLSAEDSAVYGEFVCKVYYLE